MNFMVLWLFMKDYKILGRGAFGAAKASNLRKFSPMKVFHYTVLWFEYVLTFLMLPSYLSMITDVCLTWKSYKYHLGVKPVGSSLEANLRVVFILCCQAHQLLVMRTADV